MREKHLEGGHLYTREFPLTSSQVIILICTQYLVHGNVLVPLSVVLVRTESQTCHDDIAGRPSALGTIAKQGAYKGVAKLVAPFLQNYGALAQLASLGLLACHLLGHTLMDDSENCFHNYI